MKRKRALPAESPVDLMGVIRQKAGALALDGTPQSVALQLKQKVGPIITLEMKLFVKPDLKQ